MSSHAFLTFGTIALVFCLVCAVSTRNYVHRLRRYVGAFTAVLGRLERDRNITWLYDARLVTVYPAGDPRSHAARAPDESGRRGSGEPPDDDDGDFLFQ